MSDTQDDGFPARVAAQRGRSGMTQEEFARKACISVSYVTMMERGKRVPRWKMLEVIAQALDTTPEWLMTGRALSDPGDELAGLRMVIAARKLTRADIVRVEQMVRLMFPLEDA